MKTSIDNLKWLYGFAAGVLSLVPALTYFLDTPPPHLPSARPIAGATAAAFIIVGFGYQYRRSNKNASLSAPFRHAAIILLLALVCLAAYRFLLEMTTVVIPRSGEERIQVGFRTYSWSLTPDALKWVTDQQDDPTPFDVMMAKGGFQQGGVYRIWIPWTVFFASGILISLYFSSAVVWALGWAFLAKGLSSDVSTIQDSALRDDQASKPETPIATATEAEQGNPADRKPPG